MATPKPPDGAAADKVIVQRESVIDGTVGLHENPVRLTADVGGASFNVKV
jgi:hypothetical protein